MKDYSSLRVGGEGKVVEVTSVDELNEALLFAKQEGQCVHILGQGTNSYFGEHLSGFLFIKIILKGVTFTDTDDGTVLHAFASEIWDEVVELSVSKGLRGLENLSYIPGTVGAAPIQNIGAYGSELRDVFISCEVLDTSDMTVKTLFQHDCQFGYRDSLFKHEKDRYVILSLYLRLSSTRPFLLTYKPLDELVALENLSVLQVRQKVIETRKSKLPEWREFPNCGSFFKNPTITKIESELLRMEYPKVPLIEHGDLYKVPAAWLIEHVAEMKGIKMGAVRTWEKQPLVLVNDGGATADEIDAYANEIQHRVFEKTGIILEQEVNRVG